MLIIVTFPLRGRGKLIRACCSIDTFFSHMRRIYDVHMQHWFLDWDNSSEPSVKINNTMSDRHAAEKLFSQILSDYRTNILPDVVSGWNDMSDEVQATD